MKFTWPSSSRNSRSASSCAVPSSDGMGRKGAQGWDVTSGRGKVRVSTTATGLPRCRCSTIRSLYGEVSMDVRSIEGAAPVVEHNGTVPVWWMVTPREMFDITKGGHLELVSERSE